MTEPNNQPRRPRAFDVNDPRIERVEPDSGSEPRPDEVSGAPHRPRREQGGDERSASAAKTADSDLSAGVSVPRAIERGTRWASLMVGAMASLAMLAAGVWFARFVSIAVMRDDWVGWLSLGLLGLGVLAAVVVIGREIAGLFRLGRLGRVRREADALVALPDIKRERQLIARLVTLQARQPSNTWAITSFRAHLGDVHDAGALLSLADRDLIRPLDTSARAIILAAAKRVATVTALSPIATISVLYVLIENLRLMRVLAGHYGGRPHFIGSLKLARNVVLAIIASGGLALTDDMLGQFLGQDILRRLSRRLGEGAFNGALTARLGAATVEIVRPLPYIVAQPIRARDVVAELFKRVPAGPKAGEKAGQA